jgi:hypothetical protein
MPHKEVSRERLQWLKFEKHALTSVPAKKGLSSSLEFTTKLLSCVILSQYIVTADYFCQHYCLHPSLQQRTYLILPEQTYAKLPIPPTVCFYSESLVIRRINA